MHLLISVDQSLISLNVCVTTVKCIQDPYHYLAQRLTIRKVISQIITSFSSLSFILMK